MNNEAEQTREAASAARFRERSWEALTVTERAVLTVIVGRLGAEPFGWSKLEAAGPPTLTAAQLKAGLVGLLRRDGVRSYRKAWGEPVYMIPAERYRDLHRAVLPEPVIAEGEAPVSAQPITECRPGLSFRVLQLLWLASRQELALKKDGTLAKKPIAKAAETISATDEPLRGLDWSYAHRDVYPPMVAVALDMALRLALLVPGDGRLALNPVRLRAWLSRPADSLQAELYRLWKQVCLPLAVPLQHLALAAERVPPGRWAPLARLEEWSARAAADVGSACTAAELLACWLKPLEAFGWIELGRMPDAGQDGLAFRWTIFPDGPVAESASPEPADGLYVQPDFEVLAPPGMPYEVLWKLHGFAEPLRCDVAVIFGIRRDTVLRALEEGYSCDALLAFLEGHAKYGVPDNVRVQMAEWGGQFGKVALGEAALLSCRDARTADEIARQPQLVELIERRLGPADFLVRRDRADSLAKALERAGYALRRSLPGSGEAASPAAEIAFDHSGEAAFESPPAQDRGLIYANIAEPPFAPDSAVPSWEDVFPKLKEVPAMWLTSLRTYHPSTRKEIIRQAIAWKTALRLGRPEGEALFAPTHLIEGRSEWAVTGRMSGRETTLRPEEWEEMQLILPGINDNN